MYLEPLDPECRKFLKAIRNAMVKHKFKAVPASKLEEALKCDYDDICRIAEFLEELHIVKIDKYDSIYEGFRLTQRGRMYNRYRWYDFKQTVFFSIILPLIISAVSGALTALLTLNLQPK